MSTLPNTFYVNDGLLTLVLYRNPRNSSAEGFNHTSVLPPDMRSFHSVRCLQPSIAGVNQRIIVV